MGEAQATIVACGGMKAVEYENLHLTLKFLGEVEAAKLKTLKAALDGVKTSRYRVAVKGIGVFPNPGNPKVVWAGLEAGFNETIALNKELDEYLTKLGFEPDDRFHPHITLARAKGPTDKARLNALIQASSETVFGGYEADKFILMESRLTPKGPIYTETARFSLK